MATLVKLKRESHLSMRQLQASNQTKLFLVCLMVFLSNIQFSRLSNSRQA